MRLAIVGTRSFNEYSLMDKNIREYLYDSSIDVGKLIIVSGGRRKDKLGVDTLAENWADFNEYPKLIYPPNFILHGNPEAYFVRNEQIAVACQAAICFWDGKSTGSTDVMSRFNRHGKNCKIIKYTELENKTPIKTYIGI